MLGLPFALVDGEEWTYFGHYMWYHLGKEFSPPPRGWGQGAAFWVYVGFVNKENKDPHKIKVRKRERERERETERQPVCRLPLLRSHTNNC